MPSPAQEISTSTAFPQGDGSVNSLGTAGDASAKMAADAYNKSAFATPAAYLQELKQDFDLLPKSYSGYLTKYDLDNIIHNDDNPKMRSLAQVTENHFDALQNFAGTDHKDYLTASDVDADLKLQSGNLEACKDALEKSSMTTKIESFLGASVLAAGAVLTMEVPPLAFGLAAASLVVGAKGFSSALDKSERADRAQDTSNQLRSAMAGWSDVNGGK